MEFANKRLQSRTTKRNIIVLTRLQIATKYGLRIWIHGEKKKKGFLLQCLKTLEYNDLSELITDPAAQTRTSITESAHTQFCGTHSRE